MIRKEELEFLSGIKPLKMPQGTGMNGIKRIWKWGIGKRCESETCLLERVDQRIRKRLGHMGKINEGRFTKKLQSEG